MSLELAIKENTEVMRQLIAAIQNGETFTPDEPTQPKIDSTSLKKEERKGPFYWKSLDGLKTGVVDGTSALKAIIDANAGIEISKVEYLQLQEKPKKEAPNLENLTRSEVVQLAVLYGHLAKDITEIKLQEVRSRLKKSQTP